MNDVVANEYFFKIYNNKVANTEEALFLLVFPKSMWFFLKVQNGWLVYSPMLIPRQLRFSLHSGAVITEGLM